MMYQTYTGRVKGGQPIISEMVTLPENADLIITVLNELPSINRQMHRAAFEEFFAAMSEIDDEPLGDEFDAILAKRVNIVRELDL